MANSPDWVKGYRRGQLEMIDIIFEGKILQFTKEGFFTKKIYKPKDLLNAEEVHQGLIDMVYDSEKKKMLWMSNRTKKSMTDNKLNVKRKRKDEKDT